MKYLLRRTKQALDLNKNGKVDWWEVAALFVVALVLSIIFHIVF
jgi:hypothetical protein